MVSMVLQCLLRNLNYQVPWRGRPAGLTMIQLPFSGIDAAPLACVNRKRNYGRSEYAVAGGHNAYKGVEIWTGIAQLFSIDHNISLAQT